MEDYMLIVENFPKIKQKSSVVTILPGWMFYYSKITLKLH